MGALRLEPVCTRMGHKFTRETFTYRITTLFSNNTHNSTMSIIVHESIIKNYFSACE